MLNTLKDIILNDLNKTYPDLKFNVIYGDTDSIFVEIDNSKSKIILNNKLYEEINDIINENILKRLKQLFPSQYNNYTLKVDVDKIISIIRFFGVKKRYYYLDENNKPKFKGIELARGDIPSKIKDHLHRLFYKALFKEVSNETLLEIYDDIKQSDIQELSTPRNAVMGINDYKVIPNHYRGLLLSKELGINVDMTKTDKIFSIPVILHNTDLDLFNK
jgi:DNA polymerase elongation subunit (family B)